VLDRVLYSSMHYPTDYGFIPEALSQDGDPVDALIVTNEPTFPGCLVRARPIGRLDMRDEAGPDHKVLAVPVGDPHFDTVHDLDDLSPHWLREIENFFQTYKLLEHQFPEVEGWEGVSAAWALVKGGLEAYRARREAERQTGDGVDRSRDGVLAGLHWTVTGRRGRS
jgi:inorganic pyrophosphatase